jgi:pyruvate dehydrogenase E2 component (dihydrolipoamide acetyltransferase)
MTQSAQIPQVTLTMAVDMRSAIAVRQQWVSQGTKISLIDLVLLAVARMLTRVPTLNGWAEHGQFVAASAVDLGYAIDVPNKGLYVVTLPAAQALTLEQIAEGRRLRTERVLHGKATLEDLGKPSFTVSNLGPMGVETFNPLLMPPQVGILGVGTVRSTPTEDRLMLSLTFDHRVIDGAPAAGALKQVKEGLEFPGLLL